MPITTCPCGCRWKKHIIFNRYSVAEIDAQIREDRRKEVSRRAFSTAVKQGRIIRRRVCESCGSSGIIDGHHDDYDQPFQVRWLCRPCHHRADVVRRAKEAA